MKTNYNLLSTFEPTEIQLQSLMQDVLVDVKIRAKAGKEKLDKLQKEQIIAVFEKYKSFDLRNGKV